MKTKKTIKKIEKTCENCRFYKTCRLSPKYFPPFYCADWKEINNKIINFFKNI